MKLISWNVNGLRAVYNKNALEPVWALKPDILCLQETKASEDQLPFDVRYVSGYECFFASGKKKGYSGVALYSKEKPKFVKTTFGDERFDDEGRIIQAQFQDFKLFNIYFPNGKASKERFDYKMGFYESFLKTLKEMTKLGEKIIICGDVNTAHKEIDLARPKPNAKTSGFLPQEREWIDEVLQVGFLDSFREFNKEGEQYSWWDLQSRARDRNVGWRIDYFLISENLKENLKKSYILNDIYGSDHAPVAIEMGF